MKASTEIYAEINFRQWKGKQEKVRVIENG